MPFSTTQRGPRFLRVARTLTLVSGLSLSACGGAVEASPTDGGEPYDGATLGVRADATPYDGGWTGTDVAPIYDGMPMGTSPPPYDGGMTGVDASTLDTRRDDSGYDTFSMGTSVYDGGALDAGSSDAGDPSDVLPGGPLSPPELPSEAGLA